MPWLHRSAAGDSSAGVPGWRDTYLIEYTATTGVVAAAVAAGSAEADGKMAAHRKDNSNVGTAHYGMDYPRKTHGPDHLILWCNAHT